MRTLLLGLLSWSVLTTLAFAGNIAAPCTSAHTTDGRVCLGEWSTPTTTEVTFPVVGNTGGANLYVDDGGLSGSQHDLYLMYDYWNSPNTIGTNPFTSSFDVYFEVGSTDYLVHIAQGTLSAFTNTTGQPAPENGGSFEPITNPPWVPFSGDLGFAGFKGAIGAGTNPLDPAHTQQHLIAEFELTVNSCSFDNPAPNCNGLYSPAPAFWSASAGGQGKNNAQLADPPISSGIFMLNPDGTTTVTPVLGPNGGPVLQEEDAATTPEPATILMLGSGLVGLARLLRKC
jgi:hypothetical protein